MDKQMIEEMAKLVQGDMCGDVPCEECNYHGKMKILPRYCGVYLIAEKLYNAGYRKIPENAVVLTRKEKLKEVNDLVKEKLKKFAERVKMAFYYEFDELIPSIMADKIDEICKEITDKEVQNGN